MKKRLFMIGIALVMLLSLVGCIRFEERIKFNSDGTADVRSLVAFSESALSMFGEDSATLSDVEIKEYEVKGYICETYSEDGFIGYTLTRKGVKLEEIAENGAESEMGSDLVGNFLKVDGTHVTIDFTPFTEEDYEESSTYLSLINGNNGYMRFTIELPAKPISHNATIVSKDGKTLTWDLTAMKAGEAAHAEFDLSSGSVWSWLLPVLCVVAALIIAAVVVVLLLKKKANKAAEAEEEETIVPQTEEPVVPAENETDPENADDGETAEEEKNGETAEEEKNGETAEEEDIGEAAEEEEDGGSADGE